MQVWMTRTRRGRFELSYDTIGGTFRKCKQEKKSNANLCEDIKRENSWHKATEAPSKIGTVDPCTRIAFNERGNRRH